MADKNTIPFLAQPGPAPDPLPFAAPSENPGKEVATAAVLKMDNEVLSERAMKNHIALGDQSPGVYALQQYEKYGQLDQMVQTYAERDAVNQMQQKQEIIRQVSTAAANQGRRLLPEEEQAFYSLSKKELKDFQQEPQQFLSTQFAKRVAEYATTRGEQTPFDLAMRSHPNVALDNLDRFESFVAKKEGFNKIAQVAEANLKQQGWGGYLVDIGKEILPFYTWYKTKNFLKDAPPSPLLPGSSLEAQVAYLYSLPGDRAVREADAAVKRMMLDNPQMAARFSQALLSYSQSNRFWDNVMGGLDIASVLPVGTSLKGARKLAGEFSGTVGGKIPVAAAQAYDTAARLGDALVDLGKAATMRKPTAAKVADGAGDVASSAALSTTEKMATWREGQLGRPVTAFKSLDNELPTLLDPERVLDGPRYNMAHEGARRVVEYLKNSSDEVVKKMFLDPLQTTYRLTPEVLRTVTDEAFGVFKSQYRRLEDTIVDMERKIGDGSGLVIRLGKNNGELFDSVTQATMMLRDVYGLPESAFSIKGRGEKFYGEIFRPFDMTTEGVKAARAKDVLVETNARTPIGNTIAQYLAGARSAEYVVPKDVREAFKRAAYGGSKLLETVQELAKTTTRIKDPKDFYKFLKHQQTMPDPANPGRLGVFSQTLGDFENAFHGLVGRLPTEQEATAYFAYTRINDLHYMHVNTSLYMDKLSRGIMDFKVPGVAAKLEGKLVKTIPSVGEENARVLVMLGDIPFVTHTKYTSKQSNTVRKLIDTGGYQVVQLSPTGSRALYESPELANVLKNNKTGGINFVVVRGEVASSPIPFQQIPYRPGGHHMYPEGYFVRQAQLYATKDGSVAKYFGDTNIMWAPNQETAQRFSRVMDDGRKLLLDTFNAKGQRRKGVTDDQIKAFNDWVKANLPFKPSEFKNMFFSKDALLDAKAPILHSASDVNLSNAHDLSAFNPKSRFVRDSDSQYNLYKGLPNMQYAMERGDTLQAVAMTGSKDKPIFGIQPSKLLEPMQALERSMSSMVNGRYLEELKIGTAERFLAEFGDLLDMSSHASYKHDPFLAATTAPFLKGLTGEQAIQAHAAQVFRDRWTQFMGARSADEKFMAAMAEKYLGGISPDLASGWRKNLYEILKEPGSATDKLKSYAFHAKIGLWNVKQVLTQGAGWVHILGIAGPQLGAQAGVMSMLQNLVIRRGDDITTAGAKLLPKLGFKNKEWFIEATQAMERTGFDHVGREVATREQHLNAQILPTKVGKVLDTGTIPFKVGEQFIRRAAWNAAYLEWRAVEPTAKLTDNTISHILDRADLLAGNMSQASNAAWQRGLLSIPTQFMTYQFRITEMLLGKTLTPQEKLKMLVTYSAAWGLPVGGALASFGMLPAHDQLKEYLFSKGVNIEDNKIMSMLHNGLVDMFADVVVGNNVNTTKVFGPTGQSLVVDMLDGTKGDFAALMGASGSVVGEQLAATAPFLRAIWGLINPFGENSQPLKIEDFEALISPISSAKAVDKAIVALATGNYYSKKGELVDKGNTGLSALMQAAFGLTPQHIDDLYALKRSEKDRSQWLSQHQQDVYRYMEKMFKATTADERTEYHKKALATMVGYGFTEAEKMDTMRGFFSSTRDKSIIERQLISHVPKSEAEKNLYDNLTKSWVINRNKSTTTP